jgi:hypothetical protein
MYHSLQQVNGTIVPLRASPTRAPRPASPRRRRALAQWLRRTAELPIHRDRARRFEVLLRDRVALVRPDLLELADMLERTDDPDPACVETLSELLRNGCDSPLYNSAVHESELRATLYFARAALLKSGPPLNGTVR